MTTQQVIALIVFSALIVGLYAYAYFLGRKAGRAHQQRGLLFDLPPSDASRTTIMGRPPQGSTPEGSGHASAQESIEATPASLREVRVVDAQKTESLCCEAAGIIPPSSSSTEGLIPHDKLREAAPADATLIAKNRPHAQPAMGYTQTSAASCIEAAMAVTLAEQSGAYATSEQMAKAIEAALQHAGLLSPTDESREVMRAQLDDSLIEREAEQRKCHHTLANLKRTITELEERIMTHTGMPVTRTDYDLIINAAETLGLAEKTWKVAPGTEPWRHRAALQRQDMQALAMRVHAQLRTTPSSTAVTEAAA
ncbi:hypothetical protein [Pseudomonas sp. SIMBA_068]|uniref:hypothetical protein n=2 Tax=Pseudomonadota TaxID=1224 RepID=UPI00397C4E49